MFSNLTTSNSSNIANNFSNITTEGREAKLPLEVSVLMTVIVKSITCPFTVLLNVLVIMAVKRRPRLRSNANILLACLAVTDAATGLTAQPRSNRNNAGQPVASITTEGREAKLPLEVSVLMTVIVNSITCPFTVLLNVLVIMAVKRRPRLRSKANILLACLAATDAATGLTAQPSFILWFSAQLLGVKNLVPFRVIHNFFMRSLSVCSCLHLMLVTCERLIAIKFTMKYIYIVNTQKLKVAVIFCWIFCIFCEIPRKIRYTAKAADFMIALVVISCILFVASSYVILYRETLRHQKKIKTQQLPQEEAERFAKESKALKTTVLVVFSVTICYLPLFFVFSSFVKGLPEIVYSPPMVRTLAMLNSFLNPLIYCWRQKEMRKFVFRIRNQAVNPAN